MKKIRLLRSTGPSLPRFSEGQAVEVPEETADLLCGLNLAEVIEMVPDKPMQAVPENPSIVAAEAKLEQIKDKWTSGETDKASPPPAPKAKRQPKTKPKTKE